MNTIINDQFNKVIGSPIRWAGSKTTLLPELLMTFDPNKKFYVEPFLGSGAVLINVVNNSEILGYEKFYVNDSNKNIIGFYKQLKREPNNFIFQLLRIVEEYNSLDSIEKKSDMYYQTREKFNSDNDDNKYVNFYFLMKAGFNGVYRENLNGKFNVPFGKKEKISCDENKLLSISKLLKNVTFYCKDYETFLDILNEKGIIDDAFIYCDPPYIPDDDSVYKKQTLYSKQTFDHESFCNYLTNVLNKDCKTVISMSDSSRANEIYNRLPFTKKEIRDIFRIINPKRMLASREVIFTNIK